MLAEFADWWLGQMRGLLPAGVLQSAALPDARIIAIERLEGANGPGGAILLRRKGRETALAALDLEHPPAAQAGLPICLRLPREKLLRREVTLPLAAARNAEAVIGFEMDRLTPFEEPELYWGIAGLRPDRAHGRLSLNLFFVLRAQLESLLQALRRAGLAPAFIEAEGGRIDLAGHHPVRHWRKRAMLAASAALALACLATPFLRQQIALDAAQNRIDAITPRAEIAEHLHHLLAITASGQAAIAAARQSGDALQVLATLTDALPDGTYLNDLLLKSGDLTFDGRSSNAAALIARLSAVPGLKNPSFTAPVTRTADGSADQFSMRATVRQ